MFKIKAKRWIFISAFFYVYNTNTLILNFNSNNNIQKKFFYGINYPQYCYPVITQALKQIE
jgi:hypothetical protein